MHASALNIVAFSTLAAAKTIQIKVGEGGLKFTPSSAKAAVGDVLEYHFWPQKHSVVQGNFTAGCSPAEGGFFSGFVPTAKGEAPEVFRVEVKDTKPIWFYCSQGQHCQSGMVGAINPTEEKTLEAYTTNAQNADKNVTPDGKPVGGTLAKPDASNTGSATPSGTGAATPSGSASGSASAPAASATGTGTPKSAAGHVQAAVGSIAALALGLSAMFAL